VLYFFYMNIMFLPDGGRNPTFDEKFHIPLIEGLRELTVTVWNSNTLTHDDFIGNGRFVDLNYAHLVITVLK
jgi:Ca2+-dependent lipid-binding protein